MPSAEPSSHAPVRAAGLVLTLFATAAGAAGAATLSPAPHAAPAADHRDAARRVKSVACPDDIEADEAARPRARRNSARDAAARCRAEAARGSKQAAERQAQRVAMWDELADCETGGDWHNGGDYGGGLGIYVGTWHMYGGREFAADRNGRRRRNRSSSPSASRSTASAAGAARTRLGWVN